MCLTIKLKEISAHNPILKMQKLRISPLAYLRVQGFDLLLWGGGRSWNIKLCMMGVRNLLVLEVSYSRIPDARLWKQDVGILLPWVIPEASVRCRWAFGLISGTPLIVDDIIKVPVAVPGIKAEIRRHSWKRIFLDLARRFLKKTCF